MQQFLKAMDDAAESDYKCVDEGKPAVNKQKMLADVIKFLSNRTDGLPRLILDCGALTVIDKWLLIPASRTRRQQFSSPEVRKALVKILETLPVDTHDIRATGACDSLVA